ncbi:hypothetical protein ALC53_04463 [Atta colombica]|uniref:Uncharacterized protein n=1 Tax=Atta colombica TaxID=520822 RepID=A0A195BLK3_9HYME|nr:hypothetical protein ALC53_04463 [Atta colombica]
MKETLMNGSVSRKHCRDTSRSVEEAGHRNTILGESGRAYRINVVVLPCNCTEKRPPAAAAAVLLSSSLSSPSSSSSSSSTSTFRRFSRVFLGATGDTFRDPKRTRVNSTAELSPSTATKLSSSLHPCRRRRSSITASRRRRRRRRCRRRRRRRHRRRRRLEERSIEGAASASTVDLAFREEVIARRAHRVGYIGGRRGIMREESGRVNADRG